MRHHGFYEKTGIAVERVHFCERRNEKAGICHRLSINTFVDDRLEVLSYLVGVPTQYLFQPDVREINRFAAHLPNVQPVLSWQEVLGLEGLV